MKALHGKILVKSYANQKQAIQIKGEGGKVIELWVGKQYLQNYREKNPVICEVLDNNSKYDYIIPGDFLIVHHNLLSDWKTNPFCLEYDIETGVGLYSFPVNSSVFCKIGSDGIAIPVCDNILVERLKNPVKSSHIIIPDTVKQEHNDRVKVTAISPEVEGLKEGQTILIYKQGDYEICYNWNKVDYRVIKVVESDVIGVFD